MSVRKRSLPSGWYPAGKAGTTSMISTWTGALLERERNGKAGIVPHAGWFFSGEIACGVVGSLDKTAETVVVVGGHLPKGAGFFAATEDEYETPLGNIKADKDLLQELGKTVVFGTDRYEDNTVEIQLPFIKYFFPAAMALWIRAEHSPEACGLGEAIKEAADRLSRKVVVLGSTDLTHYGPNYGFSPAGTGAEAVSWVKKINDKRIIDAFVGMNCRDVVEISAKDHSACSPGGAAAALSYAKTWGIKRGDITEYRTSYDIQPAESFVGYVGILYHS